MEPGREAFCGAAWHPGETGLPLLDGAIATLECTVVETFSAGDHDLFIGRVDALANEAHHPMPLLYYRRRYLRHRARRDGRGRGQAGALASADAHDRANGLEIAYEVVGSGPPLVLLHGASTSGRETFAAQIPALAESFQLYLPDARGHGATRWDAADGFRADWLVDDLEAFVDALGLRTFHLIGYSMGAMTALGFAAAAPERLRTLVVVGITTAREPRASVGRRLMDPGADPARRPGLGRRDDADHRSDPGSRAPGDGSCRRSPRTSRRSRC